MTQKFLVKVIALVIVVNLLLTNVSASTVYADNVEKGSTASYQYTFDEEYVSEMISHNYTRVSALYTAKAYTGNEITYYMQDVVSSLETSNLTTDTHDYGEANQVLNMVLGDQVTLKIDVKETGLYYLNFDYLSYDTSILPIKLSLMLDGEFPFYECRGLELETTWVLPEEKTYDRYDNEIATVPNKQVQWENKYLMDSSYRHSQPLALELTKGTHEITFHIKEGSVLFGAITLEAPYEVPAYSGSDVAVGNNLIQIEAEEVSYSNDSSIHAVTEYDTNLSPYKVTDTALNTLDSDSFQYAGQKVSYEFSVEEAGYYNIALNYRQSDKTDFPVFVDVAIDGTIPNTEFKSYAFDYTTKYRTETLQDEDENNLSVWLEEGIHTISFTINNDNIRNILEELDVIMSGINDLALEITKVAGTNSDKYRDLKLSKYIPNIEETLYGYAAKLYELQDSVRQYTNTTKSIATLSSMSIAAEQLISLAKEPDEIPYRVAELSSSVNSANHYLANTIDNLIKNNLALDRIYLCQEDAKLPKKTGIIKAAWMNLKRFITSFTDQDYSASNTDPEHLQVWVNRSSQYVEIMQKMIDESFTKETGIEVDISIMPDQYKLVLTNTSGDAPDVATGINYTIPYELGIRGALCDLTQFEGFQEAASAYEPGIFMSSVIGDSIYAMPETMNFWVMFYRSDVLDKLDIQVPNTWEDVISILPELQMRGLNFYYQTAGMQALRHFHGTTPMINQYNGNLYYETAQDGTAFGSVNSIDGFTFLTDLFTIYDLPVNVDSFYQHFRNGDIPIGIADYAAYNLLVNAAPELENSWDISLVPGVEQEDGSVTRYMCGGAESTVIFQSEEEREQKAWEFVQWWSSAEVQAEFGQTLQITYGSEYMWPTANLDAFMNLPWDTQAKETILEQASWILDPVRVPGTYLMERELSNAFNDIVGNGDTAQTRIDEAVKIINREIGRKLEEFGYIDSDGNTIKDYTIGTLDTVKQIVGKETEE